MLILLLLFSLVSNNMIFKISSAAAGYLIRLFLVWQLFIDLFTISMWFLTIDRIAPLQRNQTVPEYESRHTFNHFTRQLLTNPLNDEFCLFKMVLFFIS